MAIVERRIIEAKCDLCDESIDTDRSYVDAMVYGASFHTRCTMFYMPMLMALGLDDISYKMSDTDDRRDKLIYSSLVKDHSWTHSQVERGLNGLTTTKTT